MKLVEFKAWHKTLNKMYSVKSIDFKSDTVELSEIGICKRSDVVLIQYTGVKDSEGNKIFEYDFMKTQYEIILIKYLEGGFYPCRKTVDKFDKISSWKIALSGTVVGNAYENPQIAEQVGD